MNNRFVITTEPTNFHMVWDNQLNEPAMYGDRPLGSMDKAEADRIRQMLDQIHQGQQQERARA